MSRHHLNLTERWPGLVVLISVCAAIFPAAIHAELAGDPEPLKAAAEQHKANRDRIRTWQGKATVEYRTIDNKALYSDVEFVHDAKSGHFRWNLTITNSDPPDSWKNYKPGELLNGMLKDGLYYEYRSHSRSDSKGKDRPGGDLVIASPKRNRIHHDLVGFFEPMWHFTGPVGVPIDDQLTFVYDNAKNRLNKWETFQEDNILTLRNDGDNSDLEIKDMDHVVNHYEIDLSKGANLTSAHYFWREKEATLTTDYQISWERVNEVWLPKTFIRHRVEIKDGKRVSESFREVTWTENIVNKPLPNDAFSEKAVGLRPGDWVSNTLTRSFYQLSPAVAEKSKERALK